MPRGRRNGPPRSGWAQGKRAAQPWLARGGARGTDLEQVDPPADQGADGRRNPDHDRQDRHRVWVLRADQRPQPMGRLAGGDVLEVLLDREERGGCHEQLRPDPAQLGDVAGGAVRVAGRRHRGPPLERK